MNTLNPILFFIGLVALSSALSSLRHFIRRDVGYTSLRLGVHLCIAITMMVVAWFPQSARSATRYLGFGDNLNTLIFVAIIAVFLFIYKLTRVIETLETRIAKLSQVVALLEKK
ncbi:MAG: DUF2304 domain-containing protein [bacterium]